MKKLLFQIDTDPLPAVFDTVVGYDGGADHVQAYGGINPSNVGPLVDGAIFTRAPKEKKFTALFVGGSNMAAGEELFAAVKKKFFANFRVSIMLDSNGSNTTAAAGVACIARSAGGSLAGKRAVVLAGTGPVGRRAAVMLAREGASVTLTSRVMQRAQDAAAAIKQRFGLDVTPGAKHSTAMTAPTRWMARNWFLPPAPRAPCCSKASTGSPIRRSRFWPTPTPPRRSASTAWT